MTKKTRAANLKFFNLTPDDAETIYKFQNGVCALCGQPPKPGKRLYIDHDHATGLVRSGLCFRCNMFVGSLTAEFAQKIANYLSDPPASKALGAPRYGLPGKVGTKIRRERYNKLKKLPGEKNSLGFPVDYRGVVRS